MNVHSNLCKKCYWYDILLDQCYEGHIQYKSRTECESYTYCKYLNADMSFVICELNRYAESEE